MFACTYRASQVLRVTGDIVQPAALAQTRIALLQRQDQEAQQQQQEQAARQLQQQQSRRSRVLNKEEDQIEAVSKSIMPINHPIGVDPVTEVQLFNPDGCMCVYSSDSEGHCFFYGPRIDFGKPGGIYREVSDESLLGKCAEQAWSTALHAAGCMSMCMY